MAIFKKTTSQIKAVQLLIGTAKHIYLYGGSRSGKTFILIYAIVVRALKAAGSRHVIFRYRFAHAKTAIWYDTLKKVLKLFPGLAYVENRSDWFIRFPNGSEIWVAGLDEKERVEKILGNEYATIYFNEISQIAYESILIALTRLAQKTDLVNKVYYDANPPTKKHWSFKIFFTGIDPVSAEPVRSGMYACLKMNPESNRENLATNYIEDMLETLPERKRKRFLLGLYTDDVVGALWSDLIIEQNRRGAKEIYKSDLVKITVAIDPAVTSGEESDETGIIVSGKDKAGHGYVLEDLSGVYTPHEWATKGVQAFDRWEADVIVGERNNGGEMIEHTLRTVRKDISYRSVYATRGKMVRAEPVSTKYENNEVHHVGEFPELEEEMTTYTGDASDESPNRMDALVWSMYDLFMLEIDSSEPGVKILKKEDIGLF